VNYNPNNSIDLGAITHFIDKTETSVKAKRNVTVVFDKFSTFTERFPENRTYSQPQINDNAAIQS
jgi:hypothetical protein